MNEPIPEAREAAENCRIAHSIHPDDWLYGKSGAIISHACEEYAKRVNGGALHGATYKELDDANAALSADAQLQQQLADSKARAEMSEAYGNMQYKIAGELQAKLSTLRSDVKPLLDCLKKYQSRYNGAPHAQRDWDKTKSALDAFLAKHPELK